MSDETAANEPVLDEPQLSQGVATGVAAAVQAALIGVHNAYGDQLVIEGIAQYVAVGGEQDPREQWTAFVARLREVYFVVSGLKDSG